MAAGFHKLVPSDTRDSREKNYLKHAGFEIKDCMYPIRNGPQAPGTSRIFRFRGSKGTEVGLAPLAQTGPGSNLGAHFFLLLDVDAVIYTELLLPMMMML